MKIPRDLKPGDRLWYSKTEYATVYPDHFTHVPYFEEDNEDTSRGRICAQLANGSYVNYWCDDGREYSNDTPPITRVERIASAPKRVKADKDADWLCNFVEARVPMAKPSEIRRLRAIARRLDGGAP